MSDIQLKVGTKVRFAPKNEAYEHDYSLDGVSPGDEGFVTHGRGYSGDDVIVTLVRKDGVSIDNFFAFPEDLVVIDDQV